MVIPYCITNDIVSTIVTLATKWTKHVISSNIHIECSIPIKKHTFTKAMHTYMSLLCDLHYYTVE